MGSRFYIDIIKAHQNLISLSRHFKQFRSLNLVEASLQWKIINSRSGINCDFLTALK
jgi:hypothetical protein